MAVRTGIPYAEWQDCEPRVIATAVDILNQENKKEPQDKQMKG